MQGPLETRKDGISFETARLRLRMYSSADHAWLSEIMSRPETFRFSERGPMTPEEAWGNLLRSAGHWALLGYGFFAVEEKERGHLIGEAGLADFRRGLGPEFDGFPEASWTIAPSAQGKGYAREAAAAAHNWLERRFGPRRTVCLIHAENLASVRVASRLGYRPFAEREYRGYPAVLYQRAPEGT